MDKEHEIPVKVVDRRWWARGDDGGAPAERVARSRPTSKSSNGSSPRRIAIAQEYIAKYRQAASEFEESRLRLRREISKDIERGRREILADLLEVVDNLDRAIDAAAPVAVARSAAAGRRDGPAAVPVEARRARRETDRRRRRRVRSVAARSRRTVPAATPEDDGRVVGVVRHGYTIGEDVLRPASVAVAKIRTEQNLRPTFRVRAGVVALSAVQP